MTSAEVRWLGPLAPDCCVYSSNVLPCVATNISTLRCPALPCPAPALAWVPADDGEYGDDFGDDDDSGGGGEGGGEQRKRQRQEGGHAAGGGQRRRKGVGNPGGPGGGGPAVMMACVCVEGVGRGAREAVCTAGALPPTLLACCHRRSSPPPATAAAATASAAGKPGVRLTLADLQSQFGVGLKEAASRLGICPTTLKRACRWGDGWGGLVGGRRLVGRMLHCPTPPRLPCLVVARQRSLPACPALPCSPLPTARPAPAGGKASSAGRGASWPK